MLGFRFSVFVLFFPGLKRVKLGKHEAALLPPTNRRPATIESVSDDSCLFMLLALSLK